MVEVYVQYFALTLWFIGASVLSYQFYKTKDKVALGLALFVWGRIIWNFAGGK